MKQTSEVLHAKRTWAVHFLTLSCYQYQYFFQLKLRTHLRPLYSSTTISNSNCESQKKKKSNSLHQSNSENGYKGNNHQVLQSDMIILPSMTSSSYPDLKRKKSIFYHHHFSLITNN